MRISLFSLLCPGAEQNAHFRDVMGSGQHFSNTDDDVKNMVVTGDPDNKLFLREHGL